MELNVETPGKSRSFRIRCEISRFVGSVFAAKSPGLSGLEAESLSRFFIPNVLSPNVVFDQGASAPCSM